MIFISKHKRLWRLVLLEDMTHNDSDVKKTYSEHARNPRHSLAIILPNPGAVRLLGFGFAYKRIISVNGRRATRTDGEKINTELRVT